MGRVTVCIHITIYWRLLVVYMADTNTDKCPHCGGPIMYDGPYCWPPHCYTHGYQGDEE